MLQLDSLRYHGRMKYDEDQIVQCIRFSEVLSRNSRLRFFVLALELFTMADLNYGLDADLKARRAYNGSPICGAL